MPKLLLQIQIDDKAHKAAVEALRKEVKERIEHGEDGAEILDEAREAIESGQLANIGA